MADPNPESQPLFPLQNCLCCGYSLAGLPVAHQCPECGLGYDPHSHAIEVNPPQTTFSMVAGFLSWIVIAAVVVNNARNFAVSVLVGATVIGAGTHYWLFARHGRRLIMNAAGLHLASRGHLERSLGWDSIADFEFSRLDGGLVARTTGGQKVSLCRDPKLAKQCRPDIERVWAEYLQRQQPGGARGVDGTL